MNRDDLWAAYGPRNLSAGGVSRRHVAWLMTAVKGRYPWQEGCFSS
jgi:hypothetical protein